MATITQIRTKTNAAVNAEFDRNPDGSPRAAMLVRLETRLYLAALRGSWPTTPQPSEPDPPTPAPAVSSPSQVSPDAAAVTPEPEGTTPEELATIVAEETARAEALAIVTHPTHSKQQIQAERAMGEATRDD